MKRGGFLPSIPALLAVLMLASAAPARAGSTTGNVNFALGVKMLDEDDWAPVEDQGAVGVSVSWGDSSWPVQLVVDYLGSGKEEKNVLGSDVDLTGATAELGFGLQRTWNVGRTHPYVGGGLSLVFARVKLDGAGANATEDDSSPGAWIGGGVFWRLGSRFNLGVTGRLSGAEVTLAGEDVKAGGVFYGLILGWGWPATP